MRQIIFRGKQINGEWAYGDLLRIGGGCIIYIGSKTETQTPDITKDSNVAVELFDNDIAIVIPETLGQFTGFTDRNGKEIYEGDIISLRDYIAEVRWNSNLSAFCIRFSFESELGIKPLGSWIDRRRRCKVIGNIFDNPDLMNNHPTDI